MRASRPAMTVFAVPKIVMGVPSFNDMGPSDVSAAPRSSCSTISDARARLVAWNR